MKLNLSAEFVSAFLGKYEKELPVFCERLSSKDFNLYVPRAARHD